MDDLDIAVLAQLHSLIYNTEAYTTDGDDEADED